MRLLRNLKTSDNNRTKAAELTLRQSIYPITLITILFFLWGFSYGLLDTLNKHFQETLNINKARSSGLQAAYFGAYPIAALGHANWILRHYGFKLVFIWGLFLYGVGALIAWPCILHRSFGGFCAAIFVIGNGLGALETAANPYITICGPPRYSEIRINISQSFNAIGTVVAPVLGSYVFFTGTGATVAEQEASLRNVQWVYLAIACFVFLLAGVFFFSNIPEITDADMAFQAEETHAGTDVKPFWQQYRLFHAAFAQFCYTGAQIAIAGYFINYVTETRKGTPSATASQFLAGAQGAFAVGRFFGVFCMKFAKARKVFLVFMTGCIIFIAPSLGAKGNSGMAMLYITLFFESICFPTIVALGMRGLGKYSKRGSGFIVAGVSGGAVVPPILGAVADARSTAIAMAVPLCFFIAAETYAIAVNFVPAYVTVVDKIGGARIGIDTAGPRDEESGNAGEGTLDEKGGIERVHSVENGGTVLPGKM
ncbi:MFS general substrate transporter [Polychaeton citri CBS 116435]|uniref:MFS general substrate transporter n=1 Tax=Polychaeton citri CBS 116435 TaxID=1314669 RepID=A0A9P4Q1J2_9PEZI|nr:MFS general substrate transporter [Polychaeton citri CBS 116435]